MKRSSLLTLVTLIGALFISAVGYGWSDDRRVNLRGTWKFTIGDNKKYASPDYNDAEWEQIYVPADWNDEGFRRYRGYAWYRITFDIEFKANESLYLNLGRIDDSDEVFVNGQRIGGMGGFPPDYFTAYNVERKYPIPNEYLKTKGNVIAVRVYDEGGEGGILGRDVGIYNAGTYSENGITLAGNWKFHLFDDEKWGAENVDDSDWQNLVVPATWESQGFREYDGFAWYRKKFTMPKDFKLNDLVVLVGRIDDMDEVFINGHRIGGTGNINRAWARDDEWQKPRTYYIPDGVLKSGKENVIAVRVYDQTGNGGIYEGPVTIIPQSEYKEFWRRYQYDHHRERHYSTSIWSLFDWD